MTQRDGSAPPTSSNPLTDLKAELAAKPTGTTPKDVPPITGPSREDKPVDRTTERSRDLGPTRGG